MRLDFSELIIWVDRVKKQTHRGLGSGCCSIPCEASGRWLGPKFGKYHEQINSHVSRAIEGVHEWFNTTFLATNHRTLVFTGPWSSRSKQGYLVGKQGAIEHFDQAGQSGTPELVGRTVSGRISLAKHVQLVQGVELSPLDYEWLWRLYCHSCDSG